MICALLVSLSPCLLVSYLPCHAQQNRLGANFQEDADLLFVEGLYPVGKTNRGAHMAHPVIGACHFRTSHFPCHIRDETHFGRMIGNAGRNLAKRCQHRVHEG